jgi:3-phenylpropionate/trans-cinnamate dioxygenase ferredoxin reductase subunit
VTVKATLIVNGRSMLAERGSTLVDAALKGGVVIPTDCSSGQCDTCRVSVLSGELDDGGTADGATVLACQSRVCGGAEIAFDEVPPAIRCRGEVLSIKQLAPDIIQVEIRTAETLTYRPGQYVKVTFQGCPVREYSPTISAVDGLDSRVIALHIRLYANGTTSSALRGRVRAGDRVWIDGPYGTAFHRPGPSRLVLVGTGTGWAPLWAIARAARLSEPLRPIKIVVGARDPRHLYMRESLAWLAKRDVTDITLSCTSEPAGDEGVRWGRTTEFLADLDSTDTVHAAGSAPMVNAVKEIANAAGACCYADPFTSATFQPSLFQRLRLALDTGDDKHLRSRQDGRPNQPSDAAEAPNESRGRRQAHQPVRSPGGFGRWLSRS